MYLRVRAALESECARIAARVATPIDVEKLRHLVTVGSALAQASDERGASQANSDFHRQIAEITRNDSPDANLENARDPAFVGIFLDAISCADDELAAEEARKHTECTLATYHTFLEEGRG